MKFNVLTRKKNAVTNFEGAKAHGMNPQLELYAAVVTSGLSDTFYEKADTRLSRIRELIVQNDPLFVAQLAVYARTQMHLRSVPLVLLVELAKIHSGDDLIRKTVGKVVLRADEITELLAYYQLSNERYGTKKLNRLSKQLQKGLSDAFNRFDEYQFAKYNRDTEIRLRDALFLVHPKAVNESQQEVFNRIVGNQLQVAYTWETELSALGQQTFKSDLAKKQAITSTWEALIDSGKLGYMALMRNLRNILESNVSYAHLIKVCETLSNPEQVRRSKQLPFRFLSAYREISVLKSGSVTMVLDALEDAVIHSAAHLKGFGYDTSTVIACDVSGSMQKPVSRNSKVLMYDIGLMLAMMLQSRCKNVISGMFGDTWKIINVSRRNILDNVQKFYKREGEVGYATNGYKVIVDLRMRRVIVDKIFIFTDCQLWSTNTGNSLEKAWFDYKKIAPNAKLYLFDLMGYGNTPLSTNQNDVYFIAGWSDKVFDVLDALENNQSALDVIKAIDL
jgi:hypothetical protein